MTTARTASAGIITLAGVLLSAGLLWAQPNPPAAPGKPTTDVNIVSPVPVPVTVTTPISGTVEISGTPTVQIAEPVKTPFWGHDGETIPLNYVSYSINLGEIPAGQRLVIEHVSLRCLGDSDDSYDFLGLRPFLERLRTGDELVMGNRFKGNC